MDKHYIIGWKETKVGKVPVVPTELNRADKWGGLKARLAVSRMSFRVDPGIYAIGNPDQDSPVLVSANYKLSFDALRRELNGLDAWAMVLDTKGINVWCAAGKGTFGSQEIINRIGHTRLKEIVDHRALILPQLSAPGVAAHEVKKHSGFSVVYGPVRSSDILSFLDAGMVACPEMRRVRFSLLDRLLLVPAEVIQGAKYLLAAMALFFLLAGLNRNGYSTSLALDVGLRSTWNLLLAYLAGNVLGPMLLPWLPGRAFSLKGSVMGLAMFFVSLSAGLAGSEPIEIISWALIFPAAASFLTMNFTGASTYTSLSGVRKEMRTAVPLQIIAAAAGIVLWIVARFA